MIEGLGMTLDDNHPMGFSTRSSHGEEEDDPNLSLPPRAIAIVLVPDPPQILPFSPALSLSMQFPNFENTQDTRLRQVSCDHQQATSVWCVKTRVSLNIPHKYGLRLALSQLVVLDCNMYEGFGQQGRPIVCVSSITPSNI